MIKFYSSHCPKCLMLEKIMRDKKIEFELIDNEKVYLEIADAHSILSMPFAEIDGVILNTTQLQSYISNR